MKRDGIIILVICLVFAFSSCRNNADPDKNHELPESADMEPSRPDVIFELELTIPLLGSMYSFDVDEKGNIYLLDVRESSVNIYDNMGKLLYREVKKGEGPGELARPWHLALNNKENIVIYDKQKSEFIYFKNRGEYIKSLNTPNTIGVIHSFLFASVNQFYIHYAESARQRQETTDIEPGVVFIDYLAKFDENLNSVMDIYAYNDEFWKKTPKGESFYPVYPNVFCYKTDESGCLYFGYSSEYKIKFASPGRSIQTVIKKEAERILTAEEDLEKVIQNYPGIKAVEDVLRLSETKPYFSDFFIIKDIGFLVQTYENEWNNDELITCDLFNPGGKYMGKVEVPGYYHWNHHGLISEQRNRKIRNGKCYSIVFNEDKNYLELQRHKVYLQY
jgi:hypothetical protein